MLQERDDELHGESAGDIEAYLRLIWPYELSDVEPARVDGEGSLLMWMDIDAGAAAVQRKSDAPGDLRYLADSASRWNAASAVRVICPCGGDLHEVSVARQAGGGGRPPWVVIGTRCVECGLLASPIDWNVNPAG